jgi:hypothetical protein
MTNYKTGQEIRVNGKNFVIVNVRKFFPFGVVERLALTLRKPTGKKTYELIVYENGALSSIV